MRISDWSSDVCSSDLGPKPRRIRRMLPAIAFPAIDPVAIAVGPFAVRWYALAYIAGIMIGWRYCLWLARRRPVFFAPQEIGRASWRARVCQYVLLSVVALSFNKKFTSTVPRYDTTQHILGTPYTKPT